MRKLFHVQWMWRFKSRFCDLKSLCEQRRPINTSFQIYISLSAYKRSSCAKDSILKWFAALNDPAVKTHESSSWDFITLMLWEESSPHHLREEVLSPCTDPSLHPSDPWKLCCKVKAHRSQREMDGTGGKAGCRDEGQPGENKLSGEIGPEKRIKSWKISTGPGMMWSCESRLAK